MIGFLTQSFKTVFMISQWADNNMKNKQNQLL